MSHDDASEQLLEAEALLSAATERFVKVLGADRGEEVAVGLVQNRVRTLSARRAVIQSLVREAVN